MVVPGLRSRIATGLLVVAASLPVPMTAGTAMAVDVRATPAARPDAPMDDYAADPPLTLVAGHAVEGYHGRLGVPVRLPEFPSVDDLRDLPDRLLVLPGAFPRFPRHPGSPFLRAWLRHHHPHHPFGPHLRWPAYFAPDPADRDADGDSPGTSRSEPATPPRPPKAAPVRRPAHSSAPVPRHSAAPPKPGAAPTGPVRPSPLNDRDLAGPLTPGPYQPLPSPAPEQDPGTAAGPAPAESHYALDAPAARVERVLPMGAGMALTGLGLAFLGLRLRRR
ncbi:hypothetical protein GCM10010211_24760 [Streptomyces albospinus]|uniref:Uncharacterized protein n=1 Tax=Streptomyces albospinus TaxID=285515 RepID=A0ABQ2V1S0_9ACTN|nr:hypothetical protein [Streptomyces albospinus]GGU58962.1 hypothetical protein GCM10010211_24760 [Streptomyces albospinus]